MDMWVCVGVYFIHFTFFCRVDVLGPMALWPHAPIYVLAGLTPAGLGRCLRRADADDGPAAAAADVNGNGNAGGGGAPPPTEGCLRVARAVCTRVLDEAGTHGHLRCVPSCRSLAPDISRKCARVSVCGSLRHLFVFCGVCCLFFFNVF